MTWDLHEGDCREVLRSMEPESIDCIVTSPPYYGLRDYGHEGQMGREPSLSEYLSGMVSVFRECRRVLKKTGTFWLNVGDGYANTSTGGNGATGGRDKSTLRSQMPPIGTTPVRKSIPVGLKPKDLLMVPARLALALQEDGWYLRSDIIWAKPNGMPSSVTDRCTTSHEHVFMLTRSARYWSDFDAIKTPPRESSLVRTAQDLQAQAGSHRAAGKTNGTMKAVGVRGEESAPANMRDVWFIPPAQTSGDHYAVMSEEVARRCVMAGCPVGGTVLDPFAGTGTTLAVAVALGRQAVGIELNPRYCQDVRDRMATVGSLKARYDAEFAASTQGALFTEER